MHLLPYSEYYNTDPFFALAMVSFNINFHDKMFLFWYDLNLNLSKLSQLNNYTCGQSSESYKNYMSRYQPQILWKLLTSKNGPHFSRKTNDLVKNGEYDIWNNFRNDKNCIEITERGNALKKNFFYELMPIELVCCYFRFWIVPVSSFH